MSTAVPVEMTDWRPIPGLDDYLASADGQILSRKRWRGSDSPRVLAIRNMRQGYKGVRLVRADGNQRDHTIHSLVLLAFVGPRPSGLIIRHLDGDPSNNRLSNLAYGTSLENNLDTVAHGRHREASRSHCGQGHEFSGSNLLVRSDNNGRKCRECERQKAQRHNWKTRGIPKRLQVSQ